MTKIRHTTLITSPNPGKMTPHEAMIMDGCNELHEAVARSDHARIAELKRTLAKVLDEYEAANADDHPTPKWAVPHHRALVMSACADLDAAAVYEEIALRHASTDRQREISLGNLAERNMRLGRLEAALDYFFQARDVAPASVPIMLTGAQVLYLSGHTKEADGIFKAFLGMNEQFKLGTELTAYLDFETRLQVMRRALPSLDLVLRKWESMRGTASGSSSGSSDSSPSKEVPCA